MIGTARPPTAANWRACWARSALTLPRRGLAPPTLCRAGWRACCRRCSTACRRSAPPTSVCGLRRRCVLGARAAAFVSPLRLGAGIKNKVLEALQALQVHVWPHSGPIDLVEERDGWQQRHKVLNWRHLGTWCSRENAYTECRAEHFDLDSYKILLKPVMQKLGSDPNSDRRFTFSD